jgi:dTDP-glucose 4,6-dehydratase/GDP-L-fucose synthase
MATKGSGFLRSHLVEDLESRSNSVEVFMSQSNEYDLREKGDIRRALSNSGADTIIHLAATVGGISANQKNPGKYFYENAIMCIELIEMSYEFDVEKLTIAGTICAYPKHTEVSFK